MTVPASTPASTSAAGSSAAPRVRGGLRGVSCWWIWAAARASRSVAPRPRHPPTHHPLPNPPTGIIGTNLVDAEQTVETMAATQDSFTPIHAAQPGGAGLRALLQQRGVQVRGG